MLSHEKRVQVLSLLVEGMSMRAASRLTGVALGTVSALVTSMGEVCHDYHDTHFRNLACKKVQVDEMWAFCHGRSKNLPQNLLKAGLGEVWTWMAIDPDTKLIPAWHVGPQGARSATLFLKDLSKRVKTPFTLNSDGNKSYFVAVEKVFGDSIEYGVLSKVYSTRLGYQQQIVVGVKRVQRIGMPSEIHTSTVERLNLTMRMGMRRLARQTNAFSKKLENHRAAHAIYVMFYNFCRVHSTIRVTPAMAAGLSDRVWEVSDLVDLLYLQGMRQGLKCG